MLPCASAVPFNSSPASRLQRAPNPSPCNWIQPPTPSLLAQAHNAQYQQHQHLSPRRVAVVSPMRDVGVNGSPSKEATEDLRQKLPFPDALSASSSSSTSSIIQDSLGDPQKRPASNFPFSQIPCTTFAAEATPGAFVFSGQQSAVRRKRKSFGCDTKQNRKKRCSEERMVAHMSRLSLSAKHGQHLGNEQDLQLEDDDDDDEEWEDETEEDHRPFQIGLSPELQCALRGNEILPEKLLSKMKGPSKSGMELVLWRPPGNVVPPEIIASITSSPSSSSSSPRPEANSSATKNSSPADALDNIRSTDTALTLSRNPTLAPLNHDFGKNDMDMDTV